MQPRLDGWTAHPIVMDRPLEQKTRGQPSDDAVSSVARWTVPDKRAHRGPHPEDERSFAPKWRPLLRMAVAHFSWLLTRGYAEKSALKIVGDHFQLTTRQRMAVLRSACADDACVQRRKREQSARDVAGQPLLIDGYNVLTTIEAALAGGFLILGRDGCYRDMASMHGSFRRVAETAPAVEIVGRQLEHLRVAGCTWYLDRPVSNSGRLRTILLSTAERFGWQWQVELVDNPDPVLAASPEIVASADSVILDRCRRWFNLARRTVDAAAPQARVIAMDDSTQRD